MLEFESPCSWKIFPAGHRTYARNQDCIALLACTGIEWACKALVIFFRNGSNSLLSYPGCGVAGQQRKSALAGLFFCTTLKLNHDPVRLYILGIRFLDPGKIVNPSPCSPRSLPLISCLLCVCLRVFFISFSRLLLLSYECLKTCLCTCYGHTACSATWRSLHVHIWFSKVFSHWSQVAAP